MSVRTDELQTLLVKGEIALHQRRLKVITDPMCRRIVEEDLRYAKQELARRTQANPEWE